MKLSRGGRLDSQSCKIPLVSSSHVLSMTGSVQCADVPMPNIAKTSPESTSGGSEAFAKQTASLMAAMAFEVSEGSRDCI